MKACHFELLKKLKLFIWRFFYYKQHFEGSSRGGLEVEQLLHIQLKWIDPLLGPLYRSFRVLKDSLLIHYRAERRV